MIIRKYFIYFLLIHLFSCNNQNKRFESSQDISKSINSATESSISFEGKFIKIEKITERDYYLYLKAEGDSIVTFLTMMPIDSNEIKLLTKNGKNIKLSYKNYYNSVKKRTEKIVKYMQPIYDLE
jgi:hypothetical protein